MPAHKQDESEHAIRHMCHVWIDETGQPRAAAENEYSFSAFTAWMGMKGYEHYLNFRSSIGARYQAEMWFDDELKQNWRR